MQTTHMPSSSSKSVCSAVSACLPLCLEAEASARRGDDGTAGAEGAAGCWAGVAALPSPAAAAGIAGGLGALGSVANQPDRNIRLTFDPLPQTTCTRERSLFYPEELP